MGNYIELIGGLIALIAGAELLVRGASEIALRLKISRLVVGLTIVAFGTSAPELFISLRSALQGNPEIAIGNVVGSNICNVTLVLGLTAMIFPIKVTTDSLKVNWSVCMGVSVMFFLLVIDRSVDRWEGMLYVVLIVAYNFLLISGSRRQAKLEEELSGELEYPQTFGFQKWVRNVLFIVVGSVGLMYGSEFLLRGATSIAEDLFPGPEGKQIIGLTVVALGTSLPELATSVVAAFRQKADLGLGNLIGSNIFNILSILGITALVKPTEVADMFVQHDIIWMMGITLILFPVMLTRMRISRWEGAILLILYTSYIISLNSTPRWFNLSWF